MSEQSKIDAERAAFEAWVIREWPTAPLHYVRDALPKSDPRYGEYCDESLQRAWVGWQARSLPVGVPDGFRVMKPTGAILREGDRWEIYAPCGSGGIVSDHDVKDWVVRKLLDAMAAAPAAQPAAEQSAPGEVEEVEVVGYRFFHVDHGYIFRRTHIYEGNPSLEAHSLMTVAQHERIVAALSAQLREANNLADQWAEKNAALSAQQSAPERVSVDRALMQRFAHGHNSFEDIRLLQEFLASHGRGEA